jgi:DNA-binding MarR family transcriptional regulator
MNKSPFDPTRQNTNLTAKITSGLERIAGVFRVLLWDHAKAIGLSPIQIQLLIFVAHHDDGLCNVSHLAKEFNLTKPTISDALKALVQKGLTEKVPSELDKRAFTIMLTPKGKEVVASTELFASPVEASINKLSTPDKEQLFSSLQELIFGLNKVGIITVQRTCFGCRFYEQKPDGHFCNFLDKNLLTNELRIDCPEFEAL